MPYADRSPVDLDRFCRSISHITGFGRHCIGQAELVRGHQAIGHDPDIVPAGYGSNGYIDAGGGWTLQNTTDPGHIVEPAPDPTKLICGDKT